MKAKQFVFLAALMFFIGFGNSISGETIPHADVNEALTVGRTMYIVTIAALKDSIEMDLGFGKSKVKPTDAKRRFLEIEMTVTNSSPQDGALEWDDGKSSVFELIGGDGTSYGRMGSLTDPIVKANGTRNISRTFIINQDAWSGAKLYVKDMFSEKTGYFVLSKQ